MRFVRLISLALATLPAAAASEVSQGEPAANQPRAGLYRTALQLIEFEVPGASEDQTRSMREAFAEDLASGNDFCLAPDPAGAALDRELLERIAEGECTFGRFDRSGAAIRTVMLCTRDTTVGSQVTMDGRIWSENADLDMILEQELETGVTRIRARAQSARVGDC